MINETAQASGGPFSAIPSGSREARRPSPDATPEASFRDMRLDKGHERREHEGGEETREERRARRDERRAARDEGGPPPTHSHSRAEHEDDPQRTPSRRSALNGDRRGVGEMQQQPRPLAPKPSSSSFVNAAEQEEEAMEQRLLQARKRQGMEKVSQWDNSGPYSKSTGGGVR